MSSKSPEQGLPVPLETWSLAGGPQRLDRVLDLLVELAGLVSQAAPGRVEQVVRREHFEVEAPGNRPSASAPAPLLALTPPEALETGEVSVRSWVYVIGAVGYQLLTGRPLFPLVDLVALRSRIELVEPTSPSFLIADLPADAEAFLYNCLEKSAEDRYDSLEELRRAANRLRAGLPVRRLRESGFSADAQILVLGADDLSEDPAGKIASPATTTPSGAGRFLAGRSRGPGGRGPGRLPGGGGLQTVLVAILLGLFLALFL